MEVWLRGGGPEPNYDDTTLVELIRRASKTHNLNIEAEDAESLGDEMYDAMFYGVDTVEGIVALLHTAAIQAAVMRNRLAAYEDTGLEPEEIAKIREDVENVYLKSTARRYGIPVDRLRELAQADREGRVKIVKRAPEGANCGHCADFIRETGTAHGMCRTQKRKRNKNGEFRHVSQSTKACSEYKEEAEAAEQALKEAERDADTL